jgi:hypothetical protein
MIFKMTQFQEFQATQLFCQHCKTVVEVREVLLLVLPRKNLYDYRCKQCGRPVGSREETDADAMSIKTLSHGPMQGHTARRALPRRR